MLAIPAVSGSRSSRKLVFIADVAMKAMAIQIKRTNAGRHAIFRQRAVNPR